MNDHSSHDEVHLKLLKLLELNPQANQRQLAQAAGISLGKLNYCLRALIDVGVIKAANFAKSENKKKYAYLVTPKGVSEKAKITIRFLEQKQEQYERLRFEIESLKNDINKNI